ncbi:hypothetical protein JCM10450v2_008342 [Rhodotorula kratochvilovae]
MQDGDVDRLDAQASSSLGDPAAAAAFGSYASGLTAASNGPDHSGLAVNHYPPNSLLEDDQLAPTSSRLAPSSPPSTRSLALPPLSQVTGVEAFDAGALPKLPPLPAANGLAAGATAGSAPDARDASLRQLAILQSLVARQTAALRDGFPAPPSVLDIRGPLSLPPLHFPQHAPPPTPSAPEYAGQRHAADGMAPNTHHWQTDLEGLNHLPAVDPNGAPYPPLGNVTADELLAAQASLDLWSSTVFNSNTNSPTTGSPPVLHPAGNGVGAHGHGHGPLPSLAQQHILPSSLDWSALYPQSHPGAPSTSQGLSPLTAFAHASLHPSPPTSHHFLPSLSSATFPPFAPPSRNGSLSGPSSSSALGFAAPAPTPPPSAHGRNDAPFGTSPPARRTSRPNAGARGRAARAAAAASEASDDSGSGGTSPNAMGGQNGGIPELPATYTTASGVVKARELMTPDEVEEDKRRRNTEASARFRAKKKMRDAELQQSSASLRERVASLEKEKESLTNENRWLRDIVAEKAEVNPRLLDVLRQ